MILGSAAIALVVALFSQRDVIQESLGDVGPIGVTVACATGVLALGLQALAWQRLMIGFGASLPPAHALRIYGTSVAGKYIPGGVWTAYLQIELAALRGARRRATLGASSTAMVMTVVTGSMVGVFAIPVAISSVSSWTLLFALAVIPLALALHPRILNRLVNIGRPADAPDSLELLPSRTLLMAGAFSVLGWLAYGVHLVALTPQGAGSLWIFTSGYGLAFTLGFVFLLAPAGAGVRELVLIATLSSTVGREVAIATALLSRALLTLVDLAVGGVSLLAVPTHLRQRLRTRPGARTR